MLLLEIMQIYFIGSCRYRYNIFF